MPCPRADKFDGKCDKHLEHEKVRSEGNQTEEGSARLPRPWKLKLIQPIDERAARNPQSCSGARLIPRALPERLNDSFAALLRGIRARRLAEEGARGHATEWSSQSRPFGVRHAEAGVFVKVALHQLMVMRFVDLDGVQREF